ncbi:hypothetical protein IY145_13090 [Methylosinus sp. H3A]|uniref:hypothetical protein n=1 Tax=Methylosinus sp. H3A TaxID=2785786 RepID=UPI0018C2727B|nr:hypothetical protein [Methylosinus sp. H3A]MBG0810316.1 hypothetical protein [Methylosinus sp. H3A]
MICSWNDFVRPAWTHDAGLSGRWDRRRDAGVAPPLIGNDNWVRERPGAARREQGTFGERQFALALSLARTLLATRAQFVLALRDVSLSQSGRERPDALFLHTVEQNVDDALYAIGRDGPTTLEEIVRRAIDDIVNEASIATSGTPFFAD